MSRKSSDASRRDELLDEAVVEYVEAVEAGQPLDTREWLARYPSLTAELREFLADQRQVQRRTDPLQEAAMTVSLGDSSGAIFAVGDPNPERPAPVVGDYELIDEIARGGMGVVYRAQQVSLNRVVALKMILSGALASAGELVRFRAEAESFARLDHPNIMPIYEVGEHEGRPYFSMKLIDGGNLRSKLHRFHGNGRAIASLMVVVARAVHHAHQRGILHRDLKPDNILLDDEAQPYVTDFGLARRVQGDSGVTQSGAIIGTPSYMAPEQAAGHKDLTTAVDVYGLGAILYVLLSGSPPFRGETPVETVRQVLEDEPSRPRMLNPRVHRDLETICMKCLNKEPRRRYDSAEALAQDLERWLVGEPIQARRTSLWERAVKRAKRNPWAAALVIVIGLALSGSIVAGSVFHQQRLSAQKQQAEQREAELQRKRTDTRDSLMAGESLMARVELQSARERLTIAVETAESEPSLSALRNRAISLLHDVDKQLEQQEQQSAALARYREFTQHRRNVLFLGTQYTGKDLPATVAATMRAAQEALTIFGLDTDGGGRLEVDEPLAESKQAITDQCYEILLIVAEAAFRQQPPQNEQAMRLLDRAAELGSRTRSYHERRARYLAELGDKEGEAREREFANTLEPTSALDHFLLGDDQLRQGRLGDAIEEFERALQVEPSHFWSMYMAGLCRLQAQDYATARAHFTNCLSEGQGNDQGIRAWVHLHRGIAHSALHDAELAEDDFAKADQLSEYESRRRDDLLYAVLVNRGILRGHRNWESAVTDLRRAVKLKPDRYQAFANLATLFDEGGQREEAVRQLGLAIETAKPLVDSRQLEPLELIRLHKSRAELLWDHDRDAALESLRQGLGIQQYAEGYALLARHLQRTEKNPLEALQAYDASLKVEPVGPQPYNHTESFGGRAECLLQLRRHKEAARSLDLYLSAVERPNAHFYRLRGLARSKLGDYFGAINDYTQALSIQGKDKFTHTYRGWVYYATGASVLARADFQKAIEIDPDYGDPYCGLGCVRVTLGEHAKAVEDAEESLRLKRKNEREPLVFRDLWNAARVHAQATAVLDAHYGRRTYEPETRARYYGRTLELVRLAFELVRPNETDEYWRKNIEGDRAFEAIRFNHEFVQLRKMYVSEEA